MNTMRFALVPLLSLTALAQEPSQPSAPPGPAVRSMLLPTGVQAHRDLAYVENGHERQKLDLYLPEKTEGPLPVVIWIHGGGWSSGSKEQCPPLRQGYLAHGYAVASLGYRLSNHAIFPAQIEDCKAAIRWLRAHAKEYHLDGDRFGVWGSSAGGHLVALLGTSGDVKDFEVGANLDVSSRVQAVCDFYGPTDLGRFVTTPGFESHAIAGSPESRLLGGAVTEQKEQVAKANPITFVDKSDPPFLIVHGDKDVTVPINQSEMLFEALKKEGVSAHFHTIKGAGHGNGFAGKNIDDLVLGFFDARLKQKSAEIEAVTTASDSAPASGVGPQRLIANGAGRRIVPWETALARDDRNQDGKISKEEFKGPPQIFDRLDTNHDGFITKEEHEAPPAPVEPGIKPKPLEAPNPR